MQSPWCYYTLVITQETENTVNNLHHAIQILAKDSKALAPVPRLMILRGGVIAITISLLALITLAWVISLYTNMPLRNDYFVAITNPFVLAKQLLPLLLCIGALAMLRQSAYPQARAIRLRWQVIVVPIVLVVLVIATLVITKTETWQVLWLGTGATPLQCFISISVLSLPLVLALFWLMRFGATTHPHLSGALIGISAGSIASFVYAFICMEDSPLYYGSWYTLALLGCSAISLRIAPYLLRW